MTLTDKKLADKRFKRTEEAILGAFFDDNSLSVKGIAKNAGVARSTVYVHHKTIKEIIPDYERYILKKYRRNIRKILMKKNVKIETILMKALVFMMMNKHYFKIVLRGNGRKILERVMEVLSSRIINEMKISKKNRRIFEIYKSEVAVILMEWCKNGFRYDEIDQAINNIVYLMKTARIRLGVLK